MSTSAPGRRVAARRRPRPTRGGIAAAVIVLLAVGLLAAGALAQASPETRPRPTSVPVEQVTTACLGWPQAASGEISTVAAPLPEDAPEAEGGELTTAAVGGKPKEQAAGDRGAVRTLDAPGREEALAVSATGGAAVGRATFQVDRADGAGLALQQCPEPRSRWWFTGGGAGLDHQSQLVLANVDPGPAVVDVLVQGPDGLADDVGTRGITLAPGEVRTIDLLDVAPQADELSVLVDAARGRVVAGLADAFATQPAAEPGAEWVPAQPEASRALRLVPLPRSADRRTLVIANPSPDREALVEVRVSGQSGSFVPTGLEAVRVPAQSVVTEDIGDAVGQEASAVLLRSPVPVTATVRSTKAGDVSYAAAAPLLDGPAAALLGGGSEVIVTAGPGAVRTTVTAYSSAGQKVASTRLEVPASATASWRPRGRTAYVVVTPVQGRLSGGVTVTGGGGLSQVPLSPLPVSLEQPVVVPVVR
jgi:Family of unknown function (DUF5719)